jgi:hypothetical protein
MLQALTFITSTKKRKEKRVRGRRYYMPGRSVTQWQLRHRGRFLEQEQKVKTCLLTLSF